jgi:hypothetical protein
MSPVPLVPQQKRGSACALPRVDAGCFGESYFLRRAACAAASLAMGTRKGEQET